MIVQALIETINGCKILTRGKGLTKKEMIILDSMSPEDLEEIAESNSLELELKRLSIAQSTN